MADETPQPQTPAAAKPATTAAPAPAKSAEPVGENYLVSKPDTDGVIGVVATSAEDAIAKAEEQSK